MALLSLAADVAGQDDRDVADPHLEHDRVVVADALALPVGRRRVQDANLDVAEALDVARLHVSPRHADDRAPAASARRPGCGGTGTPSHIARGRQRAQQRRARRRCDRDRRASPRACRDGGRRAHGSPAATTRSPRSNVGPPSSASPRESASPPASTRSARPPGSCSSVASPWPTSRNTTRNVQRRRRHRAARRSMRPDQHQPTRSAEQPRRRSAACATRAGRARTRSTTPPATARVAGHRARATARGRRAAPDRKKPGRARDAADPARPHRSRCASRARRGHDASPATWTTVISGIAAKLRSEPRQRDAREQRRTDRRQRQLGAHRRASRASRPRTTVDGRRERGQRMAASGGGPDRRAAPRAGCRASRRTRG